MAQGPEEPAQDPTALLVCDFTLSYDIVCFPLYAEL